MKKRIFILFTMLFMITSVFAVEVEIDGLWYEVLLKTKKTTVIRYKNDDKYSGDIVIPESIEYDNTTYSVTSIGDGAFISCEALKSITIPNSVTSIEGNAFNGCTGLTSITIPNSVTSIGGGAFMRCTGLTSITIPNSVTSIEGGLFYYCISLESVTIPNSVTSIGNSAFDNCRSLKSITIPNSVTNIDALAFYESGITSITIPNSVTSIEEQTFLRCKNLASVIIGNGVTAIKSGAFAECEALSSVEMGNSVKTIGSSAFEKCYNLASITIPNSVTEIQTWAFILCKALTSITIPNSVTKIYDGAFHSCSNLNSVTLGNGIGVIGSSAFAYCPEIKDVYCYADNVPTIKHFNSPYTLCTDAFDGSYIEYSTLHVPANSVDAYNTTEPWNNFKRIIPLEGDIPSTDIPKCAKPIIYYNNGCLKFNSETDGVEFVSEITDTDINKNYTSEVELSVTYNISVYATKIGYEDSETATATLCWIDVAPQTEGITSVAKVRANAVMIKADNGIISIEGAEDGMNVSVYTIDGVQEGSAIIRNGAAMVNTNIPNDSVAIVKIGNKSVKVVMK